MQHVIDLFTDNKANLEARSSRTGVCNIVFVNQ
jgi:hypothetical protein